jgi:hypothetical protein
MHAHNSSSRSHLWPCAGRQAGEDFISTGAKREVYAAVLPPVAAAALELLLHGSVAKDMDAIFRRSEEWQQGAEHVHVLAPRAASLANEAAEYASLLGQVAESAAAGALQNVAGAARAASCAEVHSGGGGALAGALTAANQALMSRFRSAPEAAAFQALPPCAAIASADARCPLETVIELVFDVEPVQASTTDAASALL